MIDGIHIPNSAQIPNIIFDEIMRKLSDAEFRVYMCIARKTFGFNKRRDKISVSQIESMSGLTRRGVQKALQSLITGNYIVATLTKGGAEVNEYEINLTETGGEHSSPVNSVHPRTTFAANEMHGRGEPNDTGGANHVHPQNTIYKTQLQNTHNARAPVDNPVQYAEPADTLDLSTLAEPLKLYAEHCFKFDRIANDPAIILACHRVGVETVANALRQCAQEAQEPLHEKRHTPTLSRLLNDSDNLYKRAAMYLPEPSETGPPDLGEWAEHLTPRGQYENTWFFEAKSEVSSSYVEELFSRRGVRIKIVKAARELVAN